MGGKLMFLVAPMFQQQLLAGCQAAQQELFNESQGKFPHRDQLLLAIYCLTQSMVSANQASVFIPDHVYHTYGQVLFCAARAKPAFGDDVSARQYLIEATRAFGTAASLNPIVPFHRVALGNVMLLLGNARRPNWIFPPTAI
jgi:hypothetical protein